MLPTIKNFEARTLTTLHIKYCPPFNLPAHQLPPFLSVVNHWRCVAKLKQTREKRALSLSHANCPYSNIVLWSRISSPREAHTVILMHGTQHLFQKPRAPQTSKKLTRCSKCLICRIHVSTTCMSAQKNIVSLSQSANC